MLLTGGVMSLSLLFGWAGILYLFYSLQYISQDVFLYLAYLLAKYVAPELADREGADGSAVVAGLLPPMSSGRCLVSEVCQNSRERSFARTVGQGWPRAYKYPPLPKPGPVLLPPRGACSSAMPLGLLTRFNTTNSQSSSESTLVWYLTTFA